VSAVLRIRPLSIIQLVGPNGAGKSYIARRVLELAPFQPYLGNQDRPYGYLVSPPGLRPVFLVGNYSQPTGGCDQIKPVERAYDQVRAAVAKGWRVIFEGAFVMNHTRGPELFAELGCPWQVLLLTTPLATCFEAVAARREARGAVPFVQRANIENNLVRSQNYASKMRVAGATVSRVNRAEAWTMVQLLVSQQ